MNAVNITVPFLHNGVHYQGMSIHNGVDFELVDAPCSEPDRQITLEGSIVVNGETVQVSLSGVIPAVQKNCFQLPELKKAHTRKAYWSTVSLL